MKRYLGQWLGIGLSLLFLLLLIRSLHLDKVAEQLRDANYWWLIPAVAASLVSFIFRGERFRMFLLKLSPFSLLKSYQYIAINYMGNNVLPARAGEVLLSYVVKRQEEIPISSSLAVTLLGRAIDGLIMLSWLTIALLALPFPGWVRQVLVLGLVAFGGLFVVMLWLVFAHEGHHQSMRRRAENLAPSWATNFVAHIAAQLKHFREGILPLRTPRIATLALVMSLGIWFSEALVYVCVGQAVGLTFHVLELLFIVAIANLASSIPSGPAGIGAFEGVIVLGLAMFGIVAHQAAAYALLLHVTQVFPITLIGALSYARLSFGTARHSMTPVLDPSSS